MAVTVTDKPLKLIAELSKKFKLAEKNAGPRLWTEIASGLRMAAEAGGESITVPVPKELGQFIENRLMHAELKFTVQGDQWTISGWKEWKDVEAEALAAQVAASQAGQPS